MDKMHKRYSEKGEVLAPELFEKITHEVASGAMKYALLSCSCHVQINFDIAKVPPAALPPFQFGLRAEVPPSAPSIALERQSRTPVSAPDEHERTLQHYKAETLLDFFT